MTSDTATTPTEETRRNSVIRRELRDGVPVYVKQSRTQDWEGRLDQVRMRSRREADVIRRLSESGCFGKRLGAVKLVAADPDEGVLVTEEVPGRPLQEFLLDAYRRRPGKECLRALVSAGRWLRAFQRLPVSDEDHAVIGDQSPHDLVEYCAIRLRKLSSLGYTGLDRKAQDRLLATVQDCVGRSSPQDRELVLCHGDFGAFNVIWDSHVLTGIDFTQTHTGERLLDATYFLHRMQMLPIYFPWKRWPVDLWERAFLRGYGRPSATESPMYRR